jgi:sugar O-acyltransferase (sialic acid O-acetyltransferase NeuD family)
MGMQSVLIYGAGGLGREVVATLDHCTRAGQEMQSAGFIVDPVFGGPDFIYDMPVYRDFSPLMANPTWRVVVAIGDPVARRQAVLRVAQAVGDRFVTVVHPAAQIGRGVKIGAGTIVLGIATITADVSIGQHVLINPATTISHDCQLGDFATLGPAVALAGGVKVGEGTALGIGVNVAPRAVIGVWSIVGAGALVLQDIPANCTAVGSPFRVIKRRRAGWHLDQFPSKP